MSPCPRRGGSRGLPVTKRRLGSGVSAGAGYRYGSALARFLPDPRGPWQRPAATNKLLIAADQGPLSLPA